MKVSLIQMNSTNDKPRNLAQARELMERAIREESPDLIVLPEVFDFLGGTGAEKRTAAEAIPGGPAYSLCQEIAKTHGVFVHAGSILEKVPGEERLHNTTIVFDRAGKQIARYRKIHLFDIVTPDGMAYKESASIKPGDEVVTYDLDGITVGCSICYDLRFSELFIQLARKGAQVIALPAAFTLQTGKDHWEVLCRARAIETETYFLAAAQHGPHTQGNETRHTFGHSMVVDPWGQVTAMASDGVGVVSARIDPKRVEKVRQMIPVAQHRVL
ncbi:MAG: carbon-nitrogen hydrolase family protein [Alphaproteobacteria bacterium]|nr:carbon-nitrogen hydrolase family protein [Alphaproteobacteria bacterium]